MKFLSDKFKAAILEKRGKQPLRSLADEIDISHATLSRLENGKTPDLMHYAIVCNWLGVDMGTFFDDAKETLLQDILRNIVTMNLPVCGKLWAEEVFCKINKL